MNLPLILRFLFFFLNLSLQNLQEFWLMEHFLNGDKNLKNHLNDFTDCKFETNAIRNWNFIINTLVSV